MYTILITVMLLSTGSYPVAISTIAVGRYDSSDVCDKLAQALKDSRTVSNNSFHRTAQCVQVKDKP